MQHKIFEIQQKMRQINWWWRINCLCKKSRFSYILAATVFILYSCGICSISGNKKQYRKSYRKRLKRFMEKELKTYQENEKIIEQYICQIEELKKCNQQAQKGMLSEVLVKEQIGILAQKIQVLKMRIKKYVNILSKVLCFF